MPLVTLDNICLRFTENHVLYDVNATIKKGEKIALIGRNGEGKSSFMKVIAGIIKADDGNLKIKNGTTISYLEQSPPDDNNQTLFEIVAQGLGDIGELLVKYQACLNNNQIDQSVKYQNEIEQKNAWRYLHKIDAIIDRFALNSKDTLATISGGLRRRVMLAQALIQEPDLLLLDEPTNHMDITAILDLEKILKDFHGALIFISHDRSFMEAIAGKVFDLDRGKLSIFNCGYLDYIKRKESVLNAENLANTRFDKKLAQEELWIRQGVKARRARNEGRVKALQEMRQTYINLRKQQGKVKIHTIKYEQHISKIIFEVKNISYQIGELKLIEDFSTLILKGEKIGIVGGNGSGKSTLIKLLLGELIPDKGSINSSKTIEFAYFDQMRKDLEPNMRAMDFVSGGRNYININGKDKHVIGYLRQFLFTGKQAMAPIGVFSGGEKNRLMLAKILSQPANLLVLDEPTNDLDVETLELLEEMLVDYAGTVILISHDRTFINNIVSSTIVMKDSAIIEQYNGGYDDYINQNDTKLEQKNNTKAKKTNNKTTKTKTKLSYKEQQQLNILPDKIENLEQNIAIAQEKLSESYFYKTGDSQKLIVELSKMKLELENMYEKWGELDNE